jgi:hypothetical protein
MLYIRICQDFYSKIFKNQFYLTCKIQEHTKIKKYSKNPYYEIRGINQIPYIKIRLITYFIMPNTQTLHFI